MPLPVFTSCCCGCSLRTGSLIIGYLGFIGSIIFIISTSIGLADVQNLEDNISDGWRSYIISVLVIALIIYIIEFIFYSLLVAGVHKSNVRYLRIYVIAATVMLSFAAVICLLNFIGADFATAVANIIGLLLQAYFVLIVRSYYMELESPRQDNMYFQGQSQLGPQVYPAQPGYPAHPGYQSQPGYPTQPGYQSQPGYPAPPGYQAQPDYPSQPGYPVQTGYPTQPGYQAQADYPAQPGYQAQADYPAQPGYQAQADYPAQPGYQAPPAFLGQPGYSSPSDKTVQPGYQNQTHGYPLQKDLQDNSANEELPPSKY